MKFSLEIDSQTIQFGMTREEVLKNFPSAYLRFENEKLVIYRGMRGTILGLPFLSRLSFSFDKEILSEIGIGPAQEVMDSKEYDVRNNYKTYHNALKKIYGRPLRIGFYYTHDIWRFKDAIMDHYLLDRFGLQEVLQIKRKHSIFWRKK